jgi:hypothetical protein
MVEFEPVDSILVNVAAGQGFELEVTGNGVQAWVTRPDIAQGEVLGSAISTGAPKAVIVGPIPAGGPVLIRINAFSWGDSVGYTLRTHVVNPAPEHSASAVVPDRWVTDETIHAGSDRDIYTFETDTAVTVSVGLRTFGSANTVTAVLRYAGGMILGSVTGDPSKDRVYTYPQTLGPARYEIEVTGIDEHRDSVAWSPGGTPDAAYEVAVIGVRRDPESAPSVLHYGDVATETLQGVTDIDVFHFTGAAGDTVSVRSLQPAPAGQWLLRWTVNFPVGSLWGLNEGTVVLDQAGEFTIEIGAPSGGLQGDIPYEVRLSKGEAGG